MKKYRYKLTLEVGKKEPIRYVEVSPDLSLDDFHKIIQKVFAFKDYHEYFFTSSNKEYFNFASKFHRIVAGRIFKDSKSTLLRDIEEAEFTYNYDMIVFWEVTIHLEEIIEGKDSSSYLLDYKYENLAEDTGSYEDMEAMVDYLDNNSHKWPEIGLIY